MVSVNNAKQVLNLFVHNPMRSLARKPQVAQVFAEDLSKLKFVSALDVVQVHKSPLNEFMNYTKGFARQGKEYQHVAENPNSPFAKYLEFCNNNKLKKTGGRKEILVKPFGQDAEQDFYALNNYKFFLLKYAQTLAVTKEEYYQIVDKLAEIVAKRARLENPNINSALIDNAENITKWSETFYLQNRLNFDGINVHKFHDEKIFNKAVEEFKAFFEAQTGKKVFIGCPSRMEWGISTLEILNDPKVYKDVDFILISHGKNSSLITDIAHPNTWRFSDNDKSIWEYIENVCANGKKGVKGLVSCCETDGLKLAGLSELPIDDNGVKMFGIGEHVWGAFPQKGPLKYVESGIRHITGHAYTNPNCDTALGAICLGNCDYLTIGTNLEIVPYTLDFSKYRVENLV